MKFLSDRFRSYCKAAKDFCVYKVMHADDPPHRLALGIAIGIFVTFLPLIGIQMVVSFSLAWLCRANKVVGVPLVWISNPLTMVPIYYPCYALGCRLLNSSTDEWQQVYPNFIALFDEPAASWAEIFFILLAASSWICDTAILGFIHSGDGVGNHILLCFATGDSSLSPKTIWATNAAQRDPERVDRRRSSG